MTTEQARELVEAFEVDRTLADREEVRLLKVNNPRYLDALRALLKLANGK